MPKIYLCFLWHMHQPFYKDLARGEYRLPWTRLHALKDYYGMVKVLEDFPRVRQTFNLVPSLMVQIEEYATGAAVDPFLRLALKPAESLTPEDQHFILQYFFQANVSRLIQRYPRYNELFGLWTSSDRNPRRAARHFNTQALRDLQVLSQLAWIDEEFQQHDKEIRYLVEKRRDYTLADQVLMGRKQREICAAVLPVYKEFAARGQIELSTTPFYHPILPLLCDSSIAGVAHPYVALPTRFRYPEDARWQMEEALRYTTERLGKTPAGMWPSEGSVSDEVFHVAASLGVKWMATDNGVLGRTTGAGGVEQTYRPYLWRQGDDEMRLVFRDHELSDLIGFVYHRMGTEEAAAHFMRRIHENCAPILASGRDALAPIILDGENAWEYYELSGRPFLRALYQRITDDASVECVTMSEAFERMEPARLDHIFPGSWINANFDIWIGAEEDNRAWEYLVRARQAYDTAIASRKVDKAQRELAWQELMIAEGSDWCWWYGPEHESANRAEFDQLFRDHLANVYRALDLPPPIELSRPIVRTSATELHDVPASPLRPTIDGEVSSYFEWMGAGLFRVDARSGAMHGQRFIIRELHYGSDGKNLFVRLDLESTPDGTLEAHIQVETSGEQRRSSSVMVTFSGAGVTDVKTKFDNDGAGAEFAYRRILEGRLPLDALGVARGASLHLQLSLWRNGLPIAALPQHGWLEISTAEPSEWPL